MTAEQFRQVIDVDLNAPFIVSKAVIPSMIKKGHGKIINICSMMSELGRETVSAYAAAKGGLKMLTRNIASEYGEFNIQCNGIGSTSLLSQKLLLPAGVKPKTCKDLPSSSHRTRQILSTDTSCTLTAVSLPISENSHSNLNMFLSEYYYKNKIVLLKIL